MTLNSGEKLKQKSTEERKKARKKASEQESAVSLTSDPLVLTNPSAILLTEDHHRGH